MAIQIRRGNKADLQVAELLPGEPVLALDTGEVGIKSAGGDIIWYATIMGTNAAIPAIPTHIKYVVSVTPGYDDANNWMTPGMLVDVLTTVTAMSITNLPFPIAGTMKVRRYGPTDLMQEYIDIWGEKALRRYSGGAWLDWEYSTSLSGSNSNGSYIKQPDGTMVCYKTVSWTGDVATAYGALYTSGSVINLGSFAAAFTATPTIGASIALTSGSGPSGWLDALKGVSASSAGSTGILRPTSLTGGAFTVHIRAIGRWK